MKNAQNIAKKSASNLLQVTGKIKMTSQMFSAGPLNARFPYPETADWQKALGAFNFWMSADVSAQDKDGIITYNMKLTLHAEDRYNFNPGMSDIETGKPDSDNGRFEITGLGKQFMQYGEHTVEIHWQEKSKNSKPPVVKKSEVAPNTIKRR